MINELTKYLTSDLRDLPSWAIMRDRAGRVWRIADRAHYNRRYWISEDQYRGRISLSSARLAQRMLKRIR